MRKCVLALVIAAVLLAGCSKPGASQGAPTSGDQAVARAYEQHQSGVRVAGEGTVTRILSDDADGGRHQRFILTLESGHTLLIAHNIDVAPRLALLQTGDMVAYSGVYEWNEQGGVVHWTHHDPSGEHEAGWLEHDGTVYR